MSDNKEQGEQRESGLSYFGREALSPQYTQNVCQESKLHSFAAEYADTHNNVEFNILPHPAKTNNPADLQDDPAAHGGLQGAGPNAYNAKGPMVPSQEIAEGLEKPKTRDEVRLILELALGS